MTSGLAAREETLCGVFANVLGLQQVGVQDGFFDVGGDSVLALQVVARAREAGLELSVRDVFDHQTVAELATVVAEAPAAAEPTPRDVPLVTLSQDQLDEFEDDVDDEVEQRWDDETGWETGT